MTESTIAIVKFNEVSNLYELLVNDAVVSTSNSIGMWEYKLNKGMFPKKLLNFNISAFIYENCSLPLKKEKAQVDDSNYQLACLICGVKFQHQLQGHLKKMHNLTTKEYYEGFNVGPEAVYSSSHREHLSKAGDKFRASDKNPFNKHGGKFSPFSEKFVKYQRETDPKKVSYEKNLAAIKSREEAGNNSCTIGYFMKQGMTDVEAANALKTRQTTFTLKKQIENLGEEEGRKRWLKRQQDWQKTLTSKPLEEIERINNAKIWKSGGASKQSKNLFKLLNKPDSRWSDQGGEKCIKLLLNGKLHHKMIDFTLGNKVIEYFGTYWHADPRKYKDEDIIMKRRQGTVTASIIRRQDNEYLNGLRSAGYAVKVIWELDFMKNPNETVKECLEFLQS